MITDKHLTGLRPSTFLLAALSLSIGWGIRGNFGHEYGAMIPGALTAIAVCLMSGRADWRERVAYFGLFGALGWGFGGSISYMQVIGFTHSGQLSSQVYGFFCLFLIGFLWGGMGGAGTAFPAVAERDRMTAIVRPLVWILIAWFIEWRFEEWLDHWNNASDATWQRQRDPLYWLDADWFPATVALGTMCLFEIWEKRFRGMAILCLLVAAGAVGGWILQGICNLTHLSSVIAWLVVWPQADLATLAKNGTDVQAIAGNFMYNWPNFLMADPGMTGILLGAIAGAVYYFRKWGEFRDGSSLFVYMSVGWLIAFLCMPVLLGFGGAGLRMTPPRGDDWAGIVGVFIGTMIWLRRNGLLPVAYAAMISGIVGGLGFAGAAWLKLMMVSLGNPEIYSDPSVVATWAHWQSANWHSFLEQSYGFINGLGIALAMGLLARRTGVARPGMVPRPWTEVFAVCWVLFGVGWINWQKCVPEFVDNKLMAEELRAPLFDSITLYASTWFNLTFCAIALGCAWLMYRHTRRPIALVPSTWIGAGQLFYLVFLWDVVIMNIIHALPAFNDQRLLTEGVITVNALIVTFMILLLPRTITADVPEMGLIDYAPSFSKARWGLVLTLFAVCVLMPWSVRSIYNGKPAGHAGLGFRFGPDAAWRTSPIIKGQKHK